MIYIFVFASSFLMTYLIKKYAIHKNLIDIPNLRSSHDIPTPKGGGLAIILSFFMGLIYLYMSDLIDEKLFFALLCSLPLVIIGFLDDLHELSPKIRVLVQLFSVLLALYFIGSDTTFLNILFIFGMIWLINLYNFLDGIDGYATTEAIFVSLAAYTIFQNSALLLLAIAALGFLPFNWQKASIFMGDVGSTFLGFVFGIFMIFHMQSVNDFTIWLILLALFWFDATFTLVKRFFNAEKLTIAHKKHLFQRAVQAGLSHKSVTLYTILINIVAFIAVFLLKDTLLIYAVLVIYIIILFLLAKIIDKRVPFA